MFNQEPWGAVRWGIDAKTKISINVVFQTKFSEHTGRHTWGKTLAFNMRRHSHALWTAINCSAGVFGDTRQQSPRYYSFPWNCQALLFPKKLDSFGRKTKRLLFGIITFCRSAFFFSTNTKLATQSFFKECMLMVKMVKPRSQGWGMTREASIYTLDLGFYFLYQIPKFMVTSHFVHYESCFYQFFPYILSFHTETKINLPCSHIFHLTY